MMLTGTQASSRRETRPSTSGDQQEATTAEDGKGRAVESGALTKIQGSSADSSFAHRKEAKVIEIDDRDLIVWSVAFLVNGMHIVCGGREGKIRRWRVEDGQEVGTPMDAGGSVFNIAVSRDGKWIVSGTDRGLVTVWNAESFSKVTEWQAHDRVVRAVDVSPDGTRIATGSDDMTLCVWSLSTGLRLLGPLQLDGLPLGHQSALRYDGRRVPTVKFSPNGRLIAAATSNCDSVRVYDRQNGDLLVDFPVCVNLSSNQSLAWASDSKQLFALSRDGTVHCLDASTGKTLSKRAIHSNQSAMCIALASNGTFITVSAKSWVSFWDTATHEQIGSLIEHTHDVLSMAISSNYVLVTAGLGDNRITLRGLYGILPSRYCDNVRVSA
jgi:WD40 repeat protein